MQKVKEEDNIQAVVLAKMVKERRPDSDKQTAKAKTFKRVYRMASEWRIESGAHEATILESELDNARGA